jgi:hypothetical protein
VFIDEMHNLYGRGYSHDDPYGTAIIETFCPTWKTTATTW